MLSLMIVCYFGRRIHYSRHVRVAKFQGGKKNKARVTSNNASSSKGKKKVAKILRWFPLKPRLQRLFLSPDLASSMKWHVNGRTDDGIMRHPADSDAWKMFDTTHL